MRLICLVMHLVFSKILKYALQTFLRFDSNVPPQIQNSLLFMVHIHMIYTGFSHFCRKISLVAITRFGRHFLAKIGGRGHKNIFEDRGPRDIGLLRLVSFSGISQNQSCNQHQSADDDDDDKLRIMDHRSKIKD